MSTGTLKGDKSLKMPSVLISEGVANFSKFPVGMSPDPQAPSVGMLNMPVCFTHYKSAYPN